jgi:hypothetical protein
MSPLSVFTVLFFLACCVRAGTHTKNRVTFGSRNLRVREEAVRDVLERAIESAGGEATETYLSRAAVTCSVAAFVNPSLGEGAKIACKDALLNALNSECGPSGRCEIVDSPGCRLLVVDKAGVNVADLYSNGYGGS